MGVKSTIDLSRREAEEKYIECYLKLEKEKFSKETLEELSDSTRWDICSILCKVSSDISPQEACRVFIDLLWVSKKAAIVKTARHAVVDLDRNEDLEIALERINDEVHDGEGYENYIIG